MAASTSTSTFWNRWPAGRKFFYISLAIIDVLFLLGHTTERLNLKYINENVQAFLSAYSPTAFLNALRSAQDHCWVAHGWPTKSDPDDIIYGCDPISGGIFDDDQRELEKRIMGSDVYKMSSEDAKKLEVVLCEKHHVGCKDYHPSGFLNLAAKGIRGTLYVVDYLWKTALLLVWILGFAVCMIVIKNKRVAAPLGFFGGMVIGSAILMVVLWILEAFSFVLGYALGLIGFLNSAAVGLDLLREWTKFPKELEEHRRQIEGSTHQPPTTGGSQHPGT